MKLSILLPTHNRADLLPFAIESLQAQSFADFEVLVCGDGCSDATADVVAQYAAADPRIRWFGLPKAPGFGYANRNRVLREARGELIGFMAHDDLVTKDHLALLVEAMEDPAIHLACTGSVWISREGHIVPTVFSLEDRVTRGEFLAQHWNRIPATCFMHRRSAFDSAGFWNEQLLRRGDMEFWSRIIRAHGEAALRCISTITALHFRARPNELAPDEEPVWQQLHGEPGRLPPVMRWPVPANMTEQEVFWRRMVAEPQAVNELREGCHHSLMTYAWHLEQVLSAQRGLPSPGAAEFENRRLREKIAALKERIATRDAKLQKLQEERTRLKAELAASKAQRPWWRKLRLFRRPRAAACRGNPLDDGAPGRE